MTDAQTGFSGDLVFHHEVLLLAYMCDNGADLLRTWHRRHQGCFSMRVQHEQDVVRPTRATARAQEPGNARLVLLLATTHVARTLRCKVECGSNNYYFLNQIQVSTPARAWRRFAAPCAGSPAAHCSDASQGTGARPRVRLFARSRAHTRHTDASRKHCTHRVGES